MQNDMTKLNVLIHKNRDKHQSLQQDNILMEHDFISALKVYTRFRSMKKSEKTKIAEKAIWRSVFLTIWHRMLNADSTKDPSSSVTF